MTTTKDKLRRKLPVQRTESRPIPVKEMVADTVVLKLFLKLTFSRNGKRFLQLVPSRERSIENVKYVLSEKRPKFQLPVYIYLKTTTIPVPAQNAA